MREFEGSLLEMPERVVARALRAANNNIDGAREYIHLRLERQAQIEAKQHARLEQRQKRRKFGTAKDGSRVDIERVQVTGS